MKRNAKLQNGGSDNEHCSVIGILPKNSKLIVLGQVGEYFYVKTENKNIGVGTKGFVKKDSVVYIDVDKRYVTVDKNEKHVEVKIKYYNAISVDVTGTNNNVGFAAKEAKDIINVYNKNQKKGIVKQVTRQYYIIPKEEGTANLKLTHGPLRFHIFVSSYSATEKIEAFVNRSRTSQWKCASEKLPRITPNIANQYDNCTILGKIRNDWRYIERKGKKCWVKENRLTYISLNWYNKEMYRYHTVEHKAYLENSSDDKNILISVSDKKKAKIDREINYSNAKGIKVFADKSTKNNFVAIDATYRYAKGTIHRKAYLKIKDIDIIINPKEKNLEIIKSKVLEGDTIKETFTYPKITINAKIETLKGKNVEWSVVPKENVNVSVHGNNVAVQPKKNGIVKVVAKYRDIKAVCNLKVTTKTKENFLTKNEEYLKVLKKLMDYALEICDGNVQDANNLVFQYMREKMYETLQWRYSTGVVDLEKTQQLREKLNKKRYFNNLYTDGFGNELHIRHLCASINVITFNTSWVLNNATQLNEEQINLAGTTVGDLASGIGNYYAYALKNKEKCSFKKLVEVYSNLLGEDYENIFPNMSPTDLLEDIDAYNIAQMFTEDSKLTFYDAFVKYYTKNVKSAKNNYLSQYTEKEWENVVYSTVKNSLLIRLMHSGARDVLAKSNKTLNILKFNNEIGELFFRETGKEFTKLINKFYGGYRK